MTKFMSVQVKKCQLRKKPSFLGKIAATLVYGDQVTVESEKNSWVKVMPPEKKSGGWVHISALTKKKIILNPDSKEVLHTTSSEEIALAGKGFNKQVEDKFKQNNKNIDFTWVDKMEKYNISQQQMEKFILEGGLQGKGGSV